MRLSMSSFTVNVTKELSMSIKPTSYVPTGTPEEIKAAYEHTRQGFEYMCNKEYPCTPREVTFTEYPKTTKYAYVWEVEEGLYCFSDETDNFDVFEYSCIEQCKHMFDWYCQCLEEGTS